jgi:hypothetical protein
MKPSRSADKVHPGIALALLRALRDQDTPAESLEDEAFVDSLPRRLGLNDVVNIQMRRYADMRDQGRSLALSEFQDLIRLISRRPDAARIFRTAGESLATERFADSGPLSKAMRRLSTESVRRRRLLKSMSGAARALSPGSRIRAADDPPAMTLEDCALAPAGVHGSACEILTAALDVCVAEGWDPELTTRHIECAGRGDTLCSWALTEASAPAAG